MSNAYARAGVNVEAGYEVMSRIKRHIKRTERAGVMGAIGGFGGCFDISQFKLREPVLVSGTDGVGTKLLVAQRAGVHSTIGIDCVAMCVNDIIAQGAEPLYFLDYIATGKNNPAQLEQVVSGIADGCVQAGAALIGGETAEMPGLYGEDEYDLAGFAVGIAEKADLITGEKVQEGDILVGLPSSGLHSNGFSLVRQVFFETNSFTGDQKISGLGGRTLDEELLVPTRIYVEALLPLVKERLINGIAHITGGGFVENLPRMLPEGLGVSVTEGTWPVLPVFTALEEYGKIPRHEMYEIFNMGLGMVMAVSPENVERLEEILTSNNEAVYQIGKVTAIGEGDNPVVINSVTSV